MLGCSYFLPIFNVLRLLTLLQWTSAQLVITHSVTLVDIIIELPVIVILVWLRRIVSESAPCELRLSASLSREALSRISPILSPSADITGPAWWLSLAMFCHADSFSEILYGLFRERGRILPNLHEQLRSFFIRCGANYHNRVFIL
jgi:hypothetical protein